MKNTISLFLLLILLTGSWSCNNDDDGTIETCTNHGLFYTLDTNTEVYIAQGGTNTSSTVYTQLNTGTGDSVMIHELANGFIFQSSATDLNQTSVYNTELSTLEVSQLFINGVLSNPQNSNITFTCLVNDTIVGGTIRYSFSGTFTSDTNVQHTINGQVCALIVTLN